MAKQGDGMNSTHSGHVDGAALIQIQCLEDLRRFVADTLGSFELLRADQCQLSERLLYRQGSPCGVYFCLHGPRAVCLTAIWETDRNSVLFYGSNGQRMQRTILAKAPALAPPAVAAR